LFPLPHFYNNNKKIAISTVSGFSVPKESKKSIYFDPYRHISGTIKRSCNYTCKCAIRNNFLPSQHTTFKGVLKRVPGKGSYLDQGEKSLKDLSGCWPFEMTT